MQTEAASLLAARSGIAELQRVRLSKQSQANESRAANTAAQPQNGNTANAADAGTVAQTAPVDLPQASGASFTLLDPASIQLLQSDQSSAPRLNASIAPLSIGRSQIERLYDQRHASFDYSAVVSDPEAAMAEDYQDFLSEADAVVKQMQAMDETGLLEMRFTPSGPQVDISARLQDLMNQSTTPAVTQQINTALAARDRINNWLSENSAEHEAIAEKGAAYAFAAAAMDYEAQTGLNRDAAMNAGTDAANGFHLSVSRAAYNQYGVNPQTAAEATERFGQAGVFTFAAR